MSTLKKLILFCALVCGLSVFCIPPARSEWPSQCEPSALRKLRKEIEVQFDKDPKSGAIQDIQGLWQSCQYKFDKNIEVQWLASDLALYLSKNNQKHRCKDYFCAPQNYVDCDHSRQKQPWHKEPTRAERALATNVAKCLKTSETGIDAINLRDEYKIVKTSTLAICKTGPFTYVRFHPQKNDQEEVTDALIQTADSKERAAQLPGDELDPPTLDWAEDINGDGLTDLLLNERGCGSRAECVYQVYANCGKGKYVKLIRDTQYSYEMEFSKKTSSAGGAAWKDLSATFRYSNSMLGCDGELGDFVYPVVFKFNGRNYTVSKSEKAKNSKEVETKIKNIEKACKKSGSLNL